MAIVEDIKKFLGLSKPIQSQNQGVMYTNKFIGALKPYIGADNKTRYIEDFEKIKYAYAVISYIAEKSAKVPLVLFQNKADGTKERLKNHAFLNLIERPNKYQTSFSFKYQAYGYLISTGALYIYIPKLSSGRWTEMHVIPSDFVQPVYERAFEGASGFIIKDSGLTISKDEMLVIYRDSLKYEEVGVGQDGHSPMKSLLTVMQKTKDIDIADLATIQNGGVAGIIVDRTQADPWNQEQAELVEQKMRDKVYGATNRGKFLVTSGDVSFIPMGLSPVDLNLYKANNQVLRDICIVYHIPYIIFDQTDTGASFGSHMKEARKMGYTDAILPYVEMFCDGINFYGIEGFGKGIVLDYDTSLIEELQQDNKAIAETLSMQWWKPVADKQRESGMEADPKMEGVYYLPSNLIKVDELDFNQTVTALEEEFRQLEKKFEI